MKDYYAVSDLGFHAYELTPVSAKLTVNIDPDDPEPKEELSSLSVTCDDPATGQRFSFWFSFPEGARRADYDVAVYGTDEARDRLIEESLNPEEWPF